MSAIYWVKLSLDLLILASHAFEEFEVKKEFKNDYAFEEFEDEKIQVDPESNDHGFEEFKVKNEFKDDNAFEDCKNEKNSSQSGKSRPRLRRVRRQKKLRSIRKVEGRLNSLKLTMGFREDFISVKIAF